MAFRKKSHVGAVKSFYAENKTYILGAIVVYIVFKFRTLLASLVGIVSAPVAEVAASAAAATTLAADKQAVKLVAPSATPVQIASWKEAASRIAASMGHLPGAYSNMIMTDYDSLISAIKPFSYYRYADNGKWLVDTKGKLLVRTSSPNLKVLEPFYKDITVGRNLISDLDGTFSNPYSEETKMYKQFIKYKI